MGEVYRAKDTRLDRTVALKVLPEQLAADPDLRQRFEREARAVSSLNHPHICALYDIGCQDGTDFLVMEHLEGETLAARLERGPLSTELVLQYGIQMASGLDKAHRQGIVHRDLKPGNVMLTKSGAKLLDFGLAKLQAAPAAPAASVLSAQATAPRPLTERGTVLGTFQYMAPEQLEGKEADARTDIFAFVRRRRWNDPGTDEVLFKADGSSGGGRMWFEDVTADGRGLSYASNGRGTDLDVHFLSLDGSHKPSDLVRTPQAEGLSQFSPDGRWLAYAASERRGSWHTLIQPHPPTGARWQVSVAGGDEPHWRPDGKELFYMANDGTLMALDIAPTSSGSPAGPPRPLFRTPIRPALTEWEVRSRYAVAAGGQRFLFLIPVHERPRSVVVFLDWAAGLGSAPPPP